MHVHSLQFNHRMLSLEPKKYSNIQHRKTTEASTLIVAANVIKYTLGERRLLK